MKELLKKAFDAGVNFADDWGIEYSEHKEEYKEQPNFEEWFKQNVPGEYILCAAIKGRTADMAGNQLIFCGHRHCNVLWQSDEVSRHPHAQGFLTNKGRFVDRKEALEIARKAGQVTKVHNELIGLHSEDLY